ncbi:hypothetical protein F8388_023273 [Cannabis sativa]|uniref:Uncharacterized protein n=1 Tax=Cannabis sativa TaxID=3483 RepID=A0A7J6HG24_CANSA|nr:hypothetical protein F8388_023273 [Cannabis sativa]
MFRYIWINFSFKLWYFFILNYYVVFFFIFLSFFYFFSRYRKLVVFHFHLSIFSHLHLSVFHFLLRQLPSSPLCLPFPSQACVIFFSIRVRVRFPFPAKLVVRFRRSWWCEFSSGESSCSGGDLVAQRMSSSNFESPMKKTSKNTQSLSSTHGVKRLRVKKKCIGETSKWNKVPQYMIFQTKRFGTKV